MKLTKQCQQVYDYLTAHPGSSLLDIINGTGLPYAPDRLAEIRRGGVPIIAVGRRKDAEGRACKLFAVRLASDDTLPIPGV